MGFFEGTRKTRHESRVSDLFQQVVSTRGPVRRMWLSSRLVANERAHDAIVAQGILDAKPSDIRNLRDNDREMYHTQQTAYEGYKDTRRKEVLDAVILFGAIGIGVIGLMAGNILTIAAGGVFTLAGGVLALGDVAKDEQYAHIVKAHNVLDAAGVRSPIKAYRRS